MKITLKWLTENNACPEGINWFTNQEERNFERIINLFIKSKEYEKLDWGIWGICRVLNIKSRFKYLLYVFKKAVKNHFKGMSSYRKVIRTIEKFLKAKKTKEKLFYYKELEKNRVQWSGKASKWEIYCIAREICRIIFGKSPLESEVYLTILLCREREKRDKEIVNILRYGLKLYRKQVGK